MITKADMKAIVDWRDWKKEKMDGYKGITDFCRGADVVATDFGGNVRSINIDGLADIERGCDAAGWRVHYSRDCHTASGKVMVGMRIVSRYGHCVPIAEYGMTYAEAIVKMVVAMLKKIKAAAQAQVAPPRVDSVPGLCAARSDKADERSHGED